MMSIQRRTVCVLTVLLGVVSLAVNAQRGESANAEWRAWAGNLRATRYSPLDQINKNTVRRLKIAWRQPATPPAMVAPGDNPIVEHHYQHTPLMVGGLLYMSTALGTVAALDPGTGQVVWFDKPTTAGSRNAAAADSLRAS